MATAPHLSEEAQAHVERLGLTAGDCLVVKEFTVETEPTAADRQLRFTITTSEPDRERDVINASGVDLAAYLKNPVVLFGHDYKALPIGRAVQLERFADRIVATTEFVTADLNPLADQVYRMVQAGFLKGASIGFRPLEWSYDEERRGVNFEKVELLEFSVVPVPANAMALVAAGAAGLDTSILKDWAERTLNVFSEQRLGKGVSPRDASSDKADEGVAWSAPALGDFTDKPWGELAAAEKRRIAGHYTWAKEMPPAAFGDLKLPHHEPSGGKIVLRGVIAAAGRLNQADIPSADLAGVKAHLARHYRAFDREPPWETDAVGWAAVTKSVDRAMWRGGCEDGALADILDDYGFTSDAATLRECDVVAPAIEFDGFDPIRWNRQLGKAFDVEAEPLEPSKLIYGWASRFLEVPVRDIHEVTLGVPSVRMGSFLSALDETIAAKWAVKAVRNLTDADREVPPKYEPIRLNSKLSHDFLVEGVRFMEHRHAEEKTAVKVAPSWFGLRVTCYCVLGQEGDARQLMAETVRRAAELNFLKGEAFTLGGEFLQRGEQTWSDLFLTAENERPLRRAAELVGGLAEFPSRGILMMGPPGTGKTLGGRVCMNQTDATFIWVSARDFWHAGAFGGLAYAFDIAAECSPTMLFIEDVDNWLGPESIDLLKTEMDGLRRSRGIVTMLTTNHPETFPRALIDRPGRFHDVLNFELPSEAVRTRMLQAWAPALVGTALRSIVTETDGLSGAHLHELVRFAGVLQAEQHLTLDASFAQALIKIRKQRELIDAAQTYRLSREMRDRVAKTCRMTSMSDMVTKRGRALSKRNEDKIRNSRDQLNEVLAAVDAMPEEEPEPKHACCDHVVAAVAGDGNPVVLELDIINDDILELDAGVQEEVLEIDPYELGSEIQRALRDLVQAETRTAINRLRGRVD